MVAHSLFVATCTQVALYLTPSISIRCLILIKRLKCTPIVRIGHYTHIHCECFAITTSCPERHRNILHILGIYFRCCEPRWSTGRSLCIQRRPGIARIRVTVFARYCRCRFTYMDKGYVTRFRFIFITTMTRPAFRECTLVV